MYDGQTKKNKKQTIGVNTFIISIANRINKSIAYTKSKNQMSNHNVCVKSNKNK